jgi:NAD(P)H-hydrate epimerase
MARLVPLLTQCWVGTRKHTKLLRYSEMQGGGCQSPRGIELTRRLFVEDQAFRAGASRVTISLRPLTRDEVRRLDVQAASELAIPTLVLMENAGRGAAGWLAALTGATPRDHGGRSVRPSLTASVQDPPHGPSLPRILILCGPGSNGGDGAVIARHLDAWGFPIRVIWFAERNQLHGDAAVQWEILQRSRINQSAFFDINPAEPDLDATPVAAILSEADWIVDGLLGTGLSRPVEGPLRKVIELTNQSGKPVFALDVPSGLDTDTGQPLGVAVRACATATFVAVKAGFSVPGASDYTGEVAVIDIGLPRCLLEPYLIKQRA